MFADYGDEFVCLKWFEEVGCGTCGAGLGATEFLVLTRDEHNGQADAAAYELLVEFESGESGQMDIENQQ